MSVVALQVAKLLQRQSFYELCTENCFIFIICEHKKKPVPHASSHCSNIARGVFADRRHFTDRVLRREKIPRRQLHLSPPPRMRLLRCEYSSQACRRQGLTALRVSESCAGGREGFVHLHSQDLEKLSRFRPTCAVPVPQLHLPQCVWKSLRTQASMRFVANGNFFSGSFQSQHKLMKDNVKWKCVSLQPTCSASFSALRAMLKKSYVVQWQTLNLLYY